MLCGAYYYSQLILIFYFNIKFNIYTIDKFSNLVFLLIFNLRNLYLITNLISNTHSFCFFHFSTKIIQSQIFLIFTSFLFFSFFIFIQLKFKFIFLYHPLTCFYFDSYLYFHFAQLSHIQSLYRTFKNHYCFFTYLKMIQLYTELYFIKIFHFFVVFF